MIAEPKRKVLWYQYTESPTNIRESDLLEHIPVEEPQFRWLLKNYIENNLWPSVKDFDYYVRAQLKAEDIPSSLACEAYLSGNAKLIELADELETLRGGWDQIEVDSQIRAIEERLKAVLTCPAIWKLVSLLAFPQ